MCPTERRVSPKLLLLGNNLRVDTITTEVMNVLAACQIRGILLKGPTLGWLYEPDQARGYSDTDILIDPENVPRAEKVLSGLGFETLPWIEGDRPWTVWGWVRDRDGAVVEIHRSLPGIGADFRSAWQVLQQETSPMELRGRTIETLSLTGKLLFIGLHALDHRAKADKPLMDVDLATEKVRLDEWRKAASLAQQLDAIPAFAAGLRRTRNGADLAKKLELPEADSIEVALRDPSVSAYARGLDWLASVPGVRKKFSLIVHKTIPPPEYIRWWFPAARRNPWMLGLAYVWRPFWLLWKGGSALVWWLRLRRRIKSRNQM